MSDVLDKLIENSRHAQLQRLSNALSLHLLTRTYEEAEPPATLYCPICRESFLTHDDAQPPYAAIHHYTAPAPSGGSGPPPSDSEAIHLHPLTRNEL